MAETLDREDMQGLVASAYGHLPFAAYILLRMDRCDAPDARRWLAGLLPCITRATGKHRSQSLNVALTCNGLRKLDVSGEILNSFAVPFVDGMAGRRGYDDLAWDDGPAGVDALLMAYAVTAQDLSVAVDRLVASATHAGLSRVEIPNARIRANRREHFGFADGIGQPVIEGLRPRSTKIHDRDVVKNGEFVLGCTNEYGYRAEAPKLGPTGTSFGNNGTYLVFQQLSQDVAGFEKFLAYASGGDPVRRELLAAKMVGRWKNGAPLVKAPNAEDPALAAHFRGDAATKANPANDFGYAEDLGGLRCPLGAHIRRSNPRDGSLQSQASNAPAPSARHRLLRRGRSYEAESGERGLHFIALCANIERQFEFVQQTWIDNPALNDLDETDPLVGRRDLGAATFTIQAGPVRRRVTGMQTFVTLVGGAYFFVPSMSALHWLADPSYAGRTPLRRQCAASIGH
ncbi:MAG: peroxidase [Vulcanimicrobiaceae bacterium]